MILNIPYTNRLPLALYTLVCSFLLVSSCAMSNAASAEEYFAIGMAYFDLGKYSEAEKWFNKARQTDKTKTASEYNLGRIAFESGRYAEAASYFETILKQDPDNLMALKAAAYTKIKQGDTDGAFALYSRVLRLVPESADDGYNYALLLLAMDRHEEAETVLARYSPMLKNNRDSLLLYARVQDAQNKVQAVDSYAVLLETDQSPTLRFEYAGVLEKHTFYARALEQYREALKNISEKDTNPSQNQAAFALARVLLIADPQSDEGIKELQNALSLGTTTATMKTLLEESGISDAHKQTITRLIETGIVPLSEEPSSKEETLEETDPEA